MPRAFVFATLMIAAAACGGAVDDTIDITYDYCSPLVVVPAADASEEQRASIAAALEMWNQDGLTQLGIEGDANMPDDAPRVPIIFRDAASSFYGLYEDELGEVLINRGLTNERERTITVAHELGHVFGLVHVKKGDHISVMNPANLDVEPNDSDAAALRALALSECSNEN